LRYLSPDRQKEYYGGLVSGPVFKEIAEESLAYLGVFKANSSAPNMEVPEDEDEDAHGEDTLAMDTELRPMAVPDFHGKSVRMVLRIAKDRAFDVEIKGSGRAVAQTPFPGASIPEKGPVVVSFE
jgi:cell division protein FtsI (penicillin-binding protein 3)